MKRNRLEDLEICTISKGGEGMAQVFNNLSHPCGSLLISELI